ncbi:MAG: biopolymer transporter ExbD [Elusimicrobia bacterium]|nr:biopolymer transporter ExbD [Elusimicrobiota bacterium]
MRTLDGRRSYSLIAEINMIPLIDVALVLLIIFMVITPFLMQSIIQVQLPKATTGQASAQGRPIQIQVTKEGAIFLQGRRTAPTRLEHALGLVLLHPDRQPVLIQADEAAPFQSVVQVMDTAKRLGAAKLGIGVRQETP